MKALGLLYIALQLLLQPFAYADSYSYYPAAGDVHWKAPVANLGALPSSGNLSGDARILLSTFMSYVWNGSSWQTFGAAGSVTSVAMTVPAEFIVTGSPITTSGTLAITKANELPNTVFAGPSGTPSGVPAFRALVSDDIPSLAASKITSGQFANSLTTATSANTASAIVARDGSGNFIATQVTAALVGNASTSTALAANPADCGSNTYATTIAANGDLTCASITNASTTAVSTNTASTIALRDSSGDFAAGNITAALIGNASTATALAANPSDCAANTYATTIAASGNLTCASITNASTTAVSTNTASTIALRDGSGNFAAGTITAALTGTASGNTTYTANNHGVVISGSGNTMTVIAPDSSTTKVLTSGGASADPSWQSIPNTVPTVQRFTADSGSYTTPAGVKYIIVTVIGGGAGGQGSGTSGQGAGTNGNASTFGSALLSAGGGSAGSSQVGGAGGSSSVSSPAVAITSSNGGMGASAQFISTGTTDKFSGGIGGSSCQGGAGSGGGQTGDGQPGAANTGGGGGGGGVGNTASDTTGNGGGAGACLRALITAPSASYAYAVGAAANGGAAGSSGNNGGAGGSGLVVVEEYYQ